MRRNFLVGLLTAAFVLSLAWGVNQYYQANNFKINNENQYRRAFDDLSSNLDQLETVMAKGGVATNPNQKVLYLSQVWSHSNSAAKDLAQLPAEQVGISYISRFLTQTGDIANTMAQKVAAGEKIPAQYDKMFDDMHEQVLQVNRQVQKLLTRVNTENLAWTDKPPSILQRMGIGKPQIAEAAAEGQEVISKSVRGGLNQLDASLQKLPPFNYNGEYASHTVTKPLGLLKDVVTRQQSQAIARDFLKKIGFSNPNPEFAGEIQGELGGFEWKQGDAYLEISKQGGAVLIFHDDYQPQTRTLNIDQAKEKAMNVLKSLGWKNLVLTSTEDFGAYLQVDAVYQQGGIRYYPDKVRIMISFDNGKVIGFDAMPYWVFHHSRAVNKGSLLTLNSARSKLRTGFQAKEQRLALITTTGNKEVLCYEFRGNYKGEDYLIYLNANNGKEESIKRIIQTPRGEFIQ